MKQILVKIFRILFGFLCVIFFPLGLFVLGWISNNFYRERKLRQAIKPEQPISSLEEDEENEQLVVV